MNPVARNFLPALNLLALFMRLFPTAADWKANQGQCFALYLLSPYADGLITQCGAVHKLNIKKSLTPRFDACDPPERLPRPILLWNGTHLQPSINVVLLQRQCGLMPILSDTPKYTHLLRITQALAKDLFPAGAQRHERRVGESWL